MNNIVEILYFTSPTCGPCQSFSLVWEDLFKEFVTCKFAKINVADERNYPVCEKFKIKAVPTLFVGNDDMGYTGLVGVKPKYVYQELIRKALAYATTIPANSVETLENPSLSGG